MDAVASVRRRGMGNPDLRTGHVPVYFTVSSSDAL
jgi:hypothetical protein